MFIIDGNEVVVLVVFCVFEVIVIYLIIFLFGMGELFDEWVVQGKINIWGSVFKVVEL